MIILKAILIILALILLFCAGVACYAIVLMKKRPPLVLYERRTRQPDFIPLSRIPKRQVDLLVKLEDSTFYSHRGYDIEDIRDALQVNLKAGHTVYGGSTITQQLAKERFMIRPSFNYIEGQMDGYKADVLFLGVAGLQKADDAMEAAFYRETIEKMDPKEL